MSQETGVSSPGLAGVVPDWLSRVEALPLSVRAVLRFYARSGVFDTGALRLRGLVDGAIQQFLADCYAAIEAELESELGYEDVTFSYETKLTLPVELTLGYVYRRAITEAPDGYNPVTGEARTPVTERLRLPGGARDRRRTRRLADRAADQVELVEEAEAVAKLCTEALLDGDMRDAINDDEYGDFRLGGPVAAGERETVARIAQACVNERVDELFSSFPSAVRDSYEWAVEASERHQAEDPAFREALADARSGDESAVREIEREYKYASFADPPGVLTDEERAWPYCKTQYERVGVIYDGMIEMFRAAGISIREAFKRSIVLAIVGAQIWLDDIDDYRADMRDGQLTPVTAEYVLADTPLQAYGNVVSVATTYLDRTVQYAIDSESIMTGIAAEYVYLSGTPEVLPGSDG